MNDPEPQNALSIEEHKTNIEWMREDPEAGDDVLHELLCAAYPTRDAQNN